MLQKKSLVKKIDFIFSSLFMWKASRILKFPFLFSQSIILTFMLFGEEPQASKCLLTELLSLLKYSMNTVMKIEFRIEFKIEFGLNYWFRIEVTPRNCRGVEINTSGMRILIFAALRRREILSSFVTWWRNSKIQQWNYQ